MFALCYVHVSLLLICTLITFYLLHRQLLRDERLLFAGYIHPHPLSHFVQVKVQTRDETYTPLEAMTVTTDALKKEFEVLKQQFQVLQFLITFIIFILSSPYIYI